MKIYPVLSSDLYVLSCVPVSMLERLGDSDIREHLNHRRSLKFLVSQETAGCVDTATGYMSKHAEYGDISAVLAEDFRLSWLQRGVSELSDFVKKNDLQNASIVIDSLPTPYIVSAFHLSDGYITEISGYALSDALLTVVPQVKYVSISANSAIFDSLSSPAIDDISAKIPAEASEDNQLADKKYVSDIVHMNASSFRGTFAKWADVPTDVSKYNPDVYGLSTPNSNDYMIVREVNTFEEDYGRGAWDGVSLSDDSEKQGTWRFSYVGKWEISSKNGWRPEYRIEHWNFTDEQLAAINSEVTRLNRVIRTTNNPIGSTTTGVYVNGNGEVQAMSKSVQENVPTGAKFTETLVLEGDGISVGNTYPDHGYIISSAIALRNATSSNIGGIVIGRGLAGSSSSARVDASTAIKVIEVAQGDARTPEELADVFGNTIHVGAIMIVKRGYDLASAASYTGYVYNGSAWEAMAGNYSADNVILKEDIPFDGPWISVGNVQNLPGGKFLCGGKSVADAFKMIFGAGNFNIRIAYPRISSDMFIYDGSQRSPLPDISLLDSNITLTGDYTATGAGDYSFSMSIPSTGYEWSDEKPGTDRTIEWKILPVVIDPPSELEYEFADGDEISPAFDTNIYRVDGDLTARATGEYHCGLSLLNYPNYVWSDDDSISARTITWRITEQPAESDIVFALATNGNTYGFKYSQFVAAGAMDRLAYVDKNGAVKPPFTMIPALSSPGALKAMTAYEPKLSALSEYAFNQCSNLVSVDIPCIDDIQASAFLSASRLSSVFCPYVKSIGQNAFYKSYPHEGNTHFGGLSVILSSVEEPPAIETQTFNMTSAYIYVANNQMVDDFIGENGNAAWKYSAANGLIRLYALT